MSNIKERILQYAESQGEKRTKFPEKIGMNYSSFKSTSAKTTINSDAIDRLTSIYPDIDLHWLITGKKKKEENPSNIAMEDPEKYGRNYEKLFFEIVEQNAYLLEKIKELEKEAKTLKKCN